MAPDFKLQVLTHKDYRRIFDVSEKTAKTWIAQDRRKLGFKRITEGHFCALYGIAIEERRAENGLKKGKTGLM